MLTETSQLSMSTSKSPTLRTDASFTSMDFDISQSTTLENDVLSTDVKSNISQSIQL